MPYLGNVPAEAYTNTVKDSFNGDGSTTAFTLSQPSTTNNLRVVVENVIQDPTVAYSVSGTTLTFTSAPPSGTANIYAVHLGPAVMTAVPPTEITNATTYTSALTVQGAFTSQGIDDNADATAITINSSENVGIGTASPLTKLQIKTQTNGNAGFQNSTSVAGGVKINAFNDAGSASVPFEIDGSSLQFNIAAVETARIDSDGLKFNGDTAAANALDDYEEGTWTPITNGSPSYGYQLGHYTKVGNVVHFSIFMQLSVAGSASALDITLPFTSTSASNRLHAYQGWTNSWSSNGNAVQWILSPNTNYVRAYSIVASGSVTGLLVTALGTGNLVITGSYRTA